MPTSPPLLGRTLRLNAFFSGITGCLLLAANAPFAHWMGVARPAVLFGLGMLLVLFSGHLLWVARRRVSRSEGLYFVVSDALWVVSTIVVIVAFPAALSGPGKALAVFVAAIVAAFALVQSKGLREAR